MPSTSLPAQQKTIFACHTFCPPATAHGDTESLAMTDRVLRKDQLEVSLHNEKKLIKEGLLKDDNPLDLSEPFRVLCDACRRGDLKVCQEKIAEGVNINARDIFDYTPLILVSLSCCTCNLKFRPLACHIAFVSNEPSFKGMVR